MSCVEEVANIASTNTRPVQAAESRGQENIMNIHDQRTGSSSEKGGSSTMSGRPSSTSTSEGNGTDLNALRSDFNALKDTVTDYISKASTDAMDTAKKATSDVASQIGNTASGMATAATDQAKTFAAELERMGRSNPLGAIAGALLVGVVIGMIGRGGRS
jgi:ElaB/YqjD/DUF883 family membrane-anchored ribosome-binding protein